MLKNLSEVNISIAEGRLFMAALAKLTTESQTDKTPDEVLRQCNDLANDIFKDAGPLPDSEIARPTFDKALERLINCYSLESGSNTPDFILVEYLKSSLINFHQATRMRDNWYGGKRSVINDQAELWESDINKILEAK